MFFFSDFLKGIELLLLGCYDNAHTWADQYQDASWSLEEHVRQASICSNPILVDQQYQMDKMGNFSVEDNYLPKGE